MPVPGAEGNHGDMSAATLHPATTPVQGSRPHRLGDALRAVKVFLGAAFDVIVLGEYDEEAGVRRT